MWVHTNRILKVATDTSSCSCANLKRLFFSPLPESLRQEWLLRESLHLERLLQELLHLESLHQESLHQGSLHQGSHHPRLLPARPEIPAFR